MIVKIKIQESSRWFYFNVPDSPMEKLIQRTNQSERFKFCSAVIKI